MNDQDHAQTPLTHSNRMPMHPREESRPKPLEGKPASVRIMPGNPLIGRHYRLRARLGRGRLGDIYEAVDESGGAPGTQQQVVIQLLDEQLLAIPSFADEFARDAAALRAISHPHIVKWVDFGHDGNRYFLVMEFLESASLRFVLDEVIALPIEETVPIVRAVGDALQHLHAKAIVHGNLRPENVLVTYNYEVKLQDVLPLSWLSAVPGNATRAESGARIAPDVRDDVFALACLTYELVAGRHPFNANTPYEALRAGLEPMPIDGLSPRRWQAIARGLALHREHRTPTVAEFLNEFGVTGVERLRTTVSGVAASLQASAPPAPWPVSVAATERLAPPRTKSSGMPGRLLSLVVVAGLAAATFVYHDRFRDWTAELMLAIDAKIGAISVARLDKTTGGPVAARPSDVPAPTGDAIVRAPVPQVDPDSAEAPAAPSSGAGKLVAPGSRFSFVKPFDSVSEGQVAARIIVQRSGDASRPASVVWWTSENTAIAGEDYADLGRRVEKFAPGEQSRAVYVPLFNDTVAEPTKSFNVYAGRDQPARNHIDVIASMRIDIVDND